MSLNPDESRRRGRSRSPGRRDDDRDVSRGRYEEEVRERSRTVKIDRAPSPPSSRYDDDRDTHKRYEYEEETVIKSGKGRPEREETRYTSTTKKYRSDSESSVSPDRRPSHSMPSEYKHVEEEVTKRYGDRREKEYYEERKYSSGGKYDSDSDSPKYSKPDKYRSGSSINVSESFSISKGDSPPRREYGRPTSPPKYDRPTSPPKREYDRPSSPKYSSSSYAEPRKYEYAPADEKVTYTSTTRKESYSSRPERVSFSQPSASSSQTKVVTVEPGQRRASAAPPPSGGTIQTRLGSLSVSTGHSQALTLAAAPGSPLLESYHGTYQSISPMPSPLMIAAGPRGSNMDILDLNPLSPTTSKVRHARFHDSAADAGRLAKALKGNKAPDVDPLIEILPALTNDQIMDLRVEYKKLVKTGSERKGVNIAKHIKLRLKEEEPALLKACYATALGQWESEAYWANFWYQGEKSRRELLIESLMGRTNSEIRAIKDGFSDKKYSDSLTKCMKMELKEDKFKKAVLLVLEERRMEDRPYSLDRKLIEDDVRDLRKAVKAEKGGETVMIGIIVLRSDSHIREVLSVYEASFRSNFAREMLKKSGNLVGELLAHILNGVINRPVRDALLLHHALSATKSDSLRAELLISRLVRYHWDRPHMELIKREYRARYAKDLADAVKEGTKGYWGEFCEELCVRRMSDDVRRVERVERIEVSGWK